MAGFPWHALEDNLRIILKSGLITVEQEKELRGKVTRTSSNKNIYPGSLYEESLLNSSERSVLGSIVLAKLLSMAIIDSSTGESWASTWMDDERFSSLEDELLRWNHRNRNIAKDAENDQLCTILLTSDCNFSIASTKNAELNG